MTNAAKTTDAKKKLSEKYGDPNGKTYVSEEPSDSYTQRAWSHAEAKHAAGTAESKA